MTTKAMMNNTWPAPNWITSDTPISLEVPPIDMFCFSFRGPRVYAFVYETLEWAVPLRIPACLIFVLSVMAGLWSRECRVIAGAWTRWLSAKGFLFRMVHFDFAITIVIIITSSLPPSSSSTSLPSSSSSSPPSLSSSIWSLQNGRQDGRSSCWSVLAN